MDCFLEVFYVDISFCLGHPSDEDALYYELVGLRFLSCPVEVSGVGLLELAGEDEVEVEGEVDGGLEGEAVLLLKDVLITLALLFECDYLTEFS